MNDDITTKPGFNPEAQKQLAKLLAKENIRVVVGNYSTAFFDMKARTLGLPAWNFDSKYVSDMLIGHEVGHALFTPEDCHDEFHKRCPGRPFDVCNIVEDIRIERLIQDQYPGLIHSFTEGYSHFHKEDFFKLKDHPIPSLPFIDRINVKGKLRDLVEVPFSPKEQSIFDRCKVAETFEDVLDICEDILEIMPPENDPAPEDGHGQTEGSDDLDGEEGEATPTPSDDEPDYDDEDYDPTSGPSTIPAEDDADENPSDESDDDDSEGKTGKESDDEPDDDSKSSTAKASEEKDEEKDEDEDSKSDGEAEAEKGDTSGESTKDSREMTVNEDQVKSDDQKLDGCDQSVTLLNSEDFLSSNHAYSKTELVVEPTSAECLAACVIPLADVRAARKKGGASNYYSCRSSNDSSYSRYMDCSEKDAQWKLFKKRVDKDVAVLAKEFERKKAAYQYSRAEQSRTGALNISKLHSYKYDDQIFKSVTRLADAKNHGMMIFIDFSGSMQNVMSKTLERTIELIVFCNKVSIPFEVYGFTTKSSQYAKPYKTPAVGSHLNPGSTCIIELFNSETKSRCEFATLLKELWVQAGAGGNSYNLFHSNLETLGGTPLYDTIIMSHDLVTNFKKKRKVQKMNVIFLTDGEGQGVSIVEGESKQSKEASQSQSSYWGQRAYMNLKGNMININPGTNRYIYSDLIKNLRKTCGVTAIGFFISDSAANDKKAATEAYSQSLKTGATMNPFDAKNKAVTAVAAGRKRKDHVAQIPNGMGYDMYFVIGKFGLNSITQEKEFTPNDSFDTDAVGQAQTRNKLAKDFSKFSASRKNNRVFMGKFAELLG